MKARLFVVNEESRLNVISTNEVSVIVTESTYQSGEKKGKKRNNWNQTITDIVDDLLQISIGDYIFLWESGSKNIYGVYRAVSKPFYRRDEGRNDIFKIKIKIAYDFEKPINEYDIINNPYMKNRLWNIIGKKVAGKSRATTPITNEEMQFLIQSLIANNPNYKFYEASDEISVENELSFDFINQYDTAIPDSISDYIYEPFEY